jgi:dTDP-4-amino-4,6-dideoxygalactose transaminase
MTQHYRATSTLSFIDLQAQRRALGHRIDEAVARVLEHCQFIMGPEIKILEGDLAEFSGAHEVISCANGTDALGLVLMAKGLGPGDAVFCPSFTFAATAEVVAWVGATPVFVDIDPRTFNLDPGSLEGAIAAAKCAGLKPVGVIAVDMFGQPADYEPIEAKCAAHGLWLLCDAAQSFGASYKKRKVGTIGCATTTSFFPAKPLGCYGDGGAVFTGDPELAAIVRSLRVHGQGSDKYDNVRIGMNGRLDTIQAAILIEKLKAFPQEIEKRNAIAARYGVLADVAIIPHVLEDCVSTWAQYTIRVAASKRDAIAAALKSSGVPTAIYYPKPLHQQTAYKHYPVAENDLSVCERIAGEVLSLPMHPYLQPTDQDRVIDAVRDAIAGI